MMLRRMLATVVLAAAAAGAMAQDYPTKPIKLIVPFPPGGGTDIMSRVVGQKLGDMNKWTIVVDNRPGAGGNIGVEAATRSAPDGYTLVMGQTSNLAINPSLFKALPYDPLKDLVPVVLVGEGPIAIAVRAESPYKTLADLVEAAKAKPGAVTMATPGNGTVAHLSGVRLMQATGAKFEHIPYKGASAAIPDLLGGNVDFYLASVPSVQSHIASGKLRALAVTSQKRSPVFPNTPTVGETYKGFNAVTWFGILAPAGTPKPIVVKLNAAINKALADPGVRKSIESEGGEVLGGTPEQFAELMRSELANWSTLVKQSGAKVD
ncbi:MAG: Bug family tripartite tricarboxylate transporter substrate binding protein [Betaproteobacteria bacterium]